MRVLFPVIVLFLIFGSRYYQNPINQNFICFTTETNRATGNALNPVIDVLENSLFEIS
jgi:hypothetical protein